MGDFVICVRQVKNGRFKPEPSPPGEAYFLNVPRTQNDIRPPAKRDTIAHKKAWTQAVLKEAQFSESSDARRDGDIVFFVHGFNTPTKVMLERHRKIKKHLASAGYKGAVVSFAWPCNTRAVNYLEDRWDAKTSAIKLVEHGIKRFLAYQAEDCDINMHVIAHSMGAYVVREAFDDADDVASVASVSWSVSQVMLLSADISSSSMGAGHSKSSSLYRHSVRVTNYHNPYDGALKLSNVKRVGVAPRVGRIGMPSVIPAKAVDVNCAAFFAKRHPNDLTDIKDSHTFYFDSPDFFKDVYSTIQGNIDRDLIPTREKDSRGRLRLKAD